MEKPELNPREQAQEYFRLAYERQMNGELDEAIALYTTFRLNYRLLGSNPTDTLIESLISPFRNHVILA